MSTERESRDTALRLSVRQRIEHGQLPVIRSAQVIAGYGSGRHCAVCDQPIMSTQMEYVVEDCETDHRLRFHQACHAVWQLECAKTAS